jgi:hypothetical protein
MKWAGIFAEIFSGSELRWIHEDRRNRGSVGSGQFFGAVDQKQMPLMESAHRGNKNDWPWQSVVEFPHPGKGSHDSHIFRIVDWGMEGNTGSLSNRARYRARARILFKRERQRHSLAPSIATSGNRSHNFAARLGFEHEHDWGLGSLPLPGIKGVTQTIP